MLRDSDPIKMADRHLPRPARLDSAPMNREALRLWLERDPVPPPSRVSRETYEAWAPEQRRAYDKQRRQALSEPPLIGHAHFVEAWDRANDIIEDNFETGGVDRTGIRLVAPSKAGKTALVGSLLKAHYDRATSTPRHHPDAVGVPVIYLGGGATSTPKALAERACAWFDNYPSRNQSLDAIMARLCVLMDKNGTSLVILDEAQRLRPTDTHGRKSIDVLRALMNDTSATVVLSGVQSNDSGLFQPGKNFTQAEATQMQNRFEHIELSNYAQKAYREMVRGLSLAASGLPLLDDEPMPNTSLSEHLHKLLEHSNGLFGKAVERLHGAARRAMKSPPGGERFTSRNLRL